MIFYTKETLKFFNYIIPIFFLKTCRNIKLLTWMKGNRDVKLIFKPSLSQTVTLSWCPSLWNVTYFIDSALGVEEGFGETVILRCNI